jgi:hypothetical protein
LAQRTDYVVRNEMEQNNTEVVNDLCGFRWKVEQFHRETKQLTGMKEISVANQELLEIISFAPFSFGFVPNKSLLKPSVLFTGSSMIFWMIICANKSSRSMFKCTLPTS